MIKTYGLNEHGQIRIVHDTPDGIIGILAEVLSELDDVTVYMKGTHIASKIGDMLYVGQLSVYVIKASVVIGSSSTGWIKAECARDLCDPELLDWLKEAYYEAARRVKGRVCIQ